MDQLADILRRIENIVRFGTVSAIDYGATPPACKVRTGNIETCFLPFIETRAGTTHDWDPPVEGEQCIIFSPSGDTTTGVVLFGIPSEQFQPPSRSPDKFVRQFPDEARIEYNHKTGHLSVSGIKTAIVQASESVTLDTPDTFIKGRLTVDGLLTYKNGMSGRTGSGKAAVIEGDIQVSGGDVTADGIGIKKHTHTDPQGGNVSEAKA
jgi:phage baseplate assembly protein V